MQRALQKARSEQRRMKLSFPPTIGKRGDGAHLKSVTEESGSNLSLGSLGTALQLSSISSNGSAGDSSLARKGSGGNDTVGSSAVDPAAIASGTPDGLDDSEDETSSDSDDDI